MAMLRLRGVTAALSLAALLALAAPRGSVAAPLAPTCVSAASAGNDFFPDKLSFSTTATQARAPAGARGFGTRADGSPSRPRRRARR